MISADFLNPVTLVSFGGQMVTYDDNGYAILPSYTLSSIWASVQPLAKSGLKFMKEGTHYSDYISVYTDYDISADVTGVSLSNYIINDNLVYKIVTDLNYKAFTALSTNHIETVLCRDNRITYNGTAISIPYPQFDSQFAPLFNLVKLAKDTTGLTALWAFQQELRPMFPYCVVNIVGIDNVDNTNYKYYDDTRQAMAYSKSHVLKVNYGFYAYDKIEALSLLETFLIKLTNSPYISASNKLAYLSSAGSTNTVYEELYENRSIFHADCTVDFSFITELTDSTATTINKVAWSLSIQ